MKSAEMNETIRALEVRMLTTLIRMKSDEIVPESHLDTMTQLFSDAVNGVIPPVSGTHKRLSEYVAEQRIQQTADQRLEEFIECLVIHTTLTRVMDIKSKIKTSILSAVILVTGIITGLAYINSQIPDEPDYPFYRETVPIQIQPHIR